MFFVASTSPGASGHQHYYNYGTSEISLEFAGENAPPGVSWHYQCFVNDTHMSNTMARVHELQVTSFVNDTHMSNTMARVTRAASNQFCE